MSRSPIARSRREFIKSALALTALPPAINASQLLVTPVSGELDKFTVTIHSSEKLAYVPEDFLGLSYESSQLSAPDFFSAENTDLIRLFGRLSPRGVLRLGGNLSEYTVWTPAGPNQWPPSIRFRSVGADPNAKTTITPAVITPQSIRNLNEFLKQTGWRTIYGLKLAHADAKSIAAEAKFVADTLGDRLIAFQIGNEPNHYVLNGLRAPGYSFTDYFREWSALHAIIQDQIPDARFAGPDVAEQPVEWMSAFAAKAPPNVIMLTGHHYAEGPPSDPAMNLERLLAPDDRFAQSIERTKHISESAHIPYCMAETNSCFNAGKEGVSDVFGAALWAVDYAMQLARASERGVYFHGGANGWYTPIAGGSGKPFVPRPIYAGLLFCREVLGCPMVRLSVTPSTQALGVYAFTQPKRLLVVNKGSHQASLRIKTGERSSGVLWLTAGSPEDRVGITFGGCRLNDITQHDSSYVRFPSTADLMVPAFTAGLFDMNNE